MPTVNLASRRLPPGLAAGALLALALGAPAQPKKAQPPVPPDPAALQFFESKVRPILAENCFECHSGKKQRGGLRLDSRAAVLAGGDLGPAVVPGDPEKSLLIKAIHYQDRELKMPPTKRLPKEHVVALTRWVKMGAPWPGADTPVAGGTRKGKFQITDRDRAHWAFQPVKRPTVPAVKDRGWVRNPIDAFILAGLEAKDLRPNPPAPKLELLRRVTYDLTGLPPTPQEIQRFLSDASPRAYEDLLDRLLESPRYGEKWARYWLDLVRFAETNSYERDNPKPNAWRYRDWVIRAFNSDRPYDRFLREQLAGDELPDAGPDALIATGFYRLGIWDDEPSDPALARYDGLDDVLTTVGQVCLGLTIDCARCHDHKIDPIPQKDYYRLLAFFHNINHYRGGNGPTDQRSIVSAEGKRAYEAQLRTLEAKREQAQAALREIERQFVALSRKGEDGPRQSDIDDLQYRFYRSAWDKLPDFDALKHEDAGKLPRGLFDLAPRTRNDSFGFVFEGVLLVPRAGRYTFYLDSDDGSRLTVGGKKVVEYDGIHGVGTERSATVELPQGRVPIRLDYFQRTFGLGLAVGWSGPGFARRSLSASAAELRPVDLVKAITRDGLRLLGKERFARYQQLKKAFDTLKKQKVPAELALCVTEAGTRAPDTFVLLRGNPHARGPKVEPGFPVVLGGATPTLPSPLSGVQSSGRRTALADWIASPANPLTARVMANRIWQYHFGRGIVRSTSNFGLQGDRPTHPELLDWLASEFVRGGWRMKALHRVILTSSAYRMSARGTPEGLKADPANDLCWRFDMRRLTAEEIRDSILAVCGNLNLKMYGPGIYPEIPPEVLAGQSVPGRGWGKSPPEEQARRSVYVHVKRSLLLPILETFDIAETDRSTPLRFATTQPTQALAMLNSDFLNKQAAVFAGRLRREASNDEAAQVRLALLLATSRPPAAAEVRRGVGLIRGLRRDGASEEVALNYFCLMVLNLNEFVYLD